MEYDDFKPLEGQPVEIRSAEQCLQGQIAVVDRLGSGEGHSRVPFSLLITAPMEPMLQQGIYTLALQDGPSMDLFMVPIGPESQCMRYEIVFN